MTRWPIVLSIAILLVLPLGCERRKAEDYRQQSFDPDLDRPASVLACEVDPDLLEDQVAISRRIEREVTQAVRPARSAEVTSPAIEQVKKLIADVAAEVQAGEDEAWLDLFNDDDAASLRPMARDAKALAVKTQALSEAMQEKLGLEMPDHVKSALADKARGAGIGSSLVRVPVDQLTFEQRDQKVIVTAPDGDQLTFLAIGDEYRASLPAESIEALTALRQLYDAQKEYINEVLAGISRQDITAANYTEKEREIAEATIGPVMGALMEGVLSAEGPAEAALSEEASPSPEAAESSEPAEEIPDTEARP